MPQLEPLSEREQDELGEWLLSDDMPESCMDVVTLEGFLAIAIGPVTLSPATWLSSICGSGKKYKRCCGAPRSLH